jgi:hypothetical protein
MSHVIDLGAHNSDAIKVYAGRPYGENVRRAVGLDQFEESDETIIVVVPDDVFSVASSFFSGLFGDSVRKLGELEFRRRFQFRGASVAMALDEAIREALSTDSPLAPRAAISPKRS